MPNDETKLPATGAADNQPVKPLPPIDRGESTVEVLPVEGTPIAADDPHKTQKQFKPKGKGREKVTDANSSDPLDHPVYGHRDAARNQDQSLKALSVEVPYIEPTESEYCPKRLDLRRLSPEQSKTLKGTFKGLVAQGAVLKDGGHIKQPVQAVYWLLENVV